MGRIIDLKNFEPERILVIQLRQIGDVLLTTPALAALRLRYPRAKISFLTEELPAKVLWGNTDIDEIIIRPKKGFIEQLKLLRRVRAQGFDLVVDYLANLRCVILSLYSGARVTLSYRTHRRWMFYKVPVVPEGTFSAEQKLSMLRVLGCPQGSLDLKMALPEKALDVARKFWREHGLNDGRPVVCMELFHKRPVRQWYGEHFAGLMDLIKRNRDAHVVVCWGPGKQDEARAILDAAEEEHFLAPPTDLHEMAAFYKMSDIYVGNDCGPRHIAASQGLPTFVILGPTGDDWTPPDKRHITVSKDIACRPCNLRECPEGHHACMKDLGPEEVFQALDAFWEEVL